MRFDGIKLWFFGLAVAGMAAAAAYDPTVAPGAGAKKALVRQTPGQAVAMAAAFLPTLPKEDWSYIRFLSAYHITNEDDLTAVWKAAAFALNSVSRRRTLKRPEPVPGTDGRLAWFDLRWYNLPAKAMDDLAAKGSGAVPVPQPFFHLSVFKEEEVESVETVTVQEPYRFYQNGALYEGKREVTRQQPVRKKTGKKVASQLQAPWLPVLEAEALAKATDTLYYMYRVDWFIAYALIEPRYHELLGLDDTEDSFHKLALLDDKNKWKIELRGSSDSKLVALNNRILIRWTTINGIPSGYYWESNDFASSIDGNDVLADLFAKAQAEEVIFSLPNGLQAYGLFVDNKRLDKAAADVAIDSETKHQDRQVWSARNCITCHAQGMRDFENLIKKLPQKQIALMVPDKKKAEKVSDIYFAADIEAIIKADQALYTAAVKAVNGLTAPANAMLYDKIEFGYTETTLDMAAMAADVGLPVDKVADVLKRAVNLDHSLVRVLQDPPMKTRREQWDRRGFAQLQLLLIAANALPHSGSTRPPAPPEAAEK